MSKKDLLSINKFDIDSDFPNISSVKESVSASDITSPEYDSFLSIRKFLKKNTLLQHVGGRHFSESDLSNNERTSRKESSTEKKNSESILSDSQRKASSTQKKNNDSSKKGNNEGKDNDDSSLIDISDDSESSVSFDQKGGKKGERKKTKQKTKIDVVVSEQKEYVIDRLGTPIKKRARQYGGVRHVNSDELYTRSEDNYDSDYHSSTIFGPRR